MENAFAVNIGVASLSTRLQYCLRIDVSWQFHMSHLKTTPENRTREFALPFADAYNVIYDDLWRPLKYAQKFMNVKILTSLQILCAIKVNREIYQQHLFSTSDSLNSSSTLTRVNSCACYIWCFYTQALILLQISL